MLFENQRHIHEKLDFFCTTNNVPNILFCGPTGSGKSTIIHNFIHQIYNQDAVKIKNYTKYIDCTHSKGIKFIREDLKFFAQSNFIDENTFKIIILQNADKLTIDAQSALRRYIEIFIKTTRFFIDVVEEFGLIKPILSRFCTLYIPLPVSDKTKKIVNLYKLNMTRNPNSTILTKINATNRDNIRKKIQLLLKKHHSLTNTNVLCMADALYKAGVSSLDVVILIKNGTLMHNNLALQYDILYAFNNLQKEIRCEKLLMATLLQSIVTHTNIIQSFDLDGQKEDK